MITEELSFDMSSTSFLDITREVQSFAAKCGADGLVHVFAPHATAGLALIETGSGTEPDLAATIDRLLPVTGDYRHSHGSPGHGRDHVLPAFISPSLTIPLLDGSLALGTWQSVVLVDTNRDNPRRHVRLSFVPG